MKTRHFLHITFALIAGFSFGQEELYDHRLDEDKWEDIRDNIRYEGHEENSAGREWTYESKEDYQQAKERKGGGNGGGSGDGSGNGSGSGDEPYEYKPRPDNPEVDVDNTGMGVIGYILMGVLILALLVMIYYMFLNMEKDGAKVKVNYDIDEVDPVEIPLSELERMLKEALEKGDYRGAVRIYFTFIIKGLAERGWIKWEKEKTNFHYLREMSGKNEFDDFNRSVSFFEIIWYGKRELDASQFEKVKPNFTQFLNKLDIK